VRHLHTAELDAADGVAEDAQSRLPGCIGGACAGASATSDCGHGAQRLTCCEGYGSSGNGWRFVRRRLFFLDSRTNVFRGSTQPKNAVGVPEKMAEVIASQEELIENLVARCRQLEDLALEQHERLEAREIGGRRAQETPQRGPRKDLRLPSRSMPMSLTLQAWTPPATAPGTPPRVGSARPGRQTPQAPWTPQASPSLRRVLSSGSLSSACQRTASNAGAFAPRGLGVLAGGSRLVAEVRAAEGACAADASSLSPDVTGRSAAARRDSSGSCLAWHIASGRVPRGLRFPARSVSPPPMSPCRGFKGASPAAGRAPSSGQLPSGRSASPPGLGVIPWRAQRR
ncbi:unnamed protein product, partial [Polarella glacialis]